MNIFNTISGVNLIIIGSPDSSVEGHSAKIVANPSLRILVGCRQPQPSSVSSPHLLIFFANSKTYFQRASPINFNACLYFSLLINNLLHLKQTVRKHFKIVLKN